MLHLIQEGGFIMAPLLICSLLIWAVTLEKLWFLSKFDQRSSTLHAKAADLLKENKLHEARGLCRSYHPIVGAPYLALMEQSKAGVERRLEESRLGMRRFLWILGTIGSSAPFIGLFGTVVGIIKSFESIARTGKSGFAVVAAGLSEALIATAAGIIVAVIAVVLYNYFQTRLSTTLILFKNRVEDLKDQMNVGDKVEL
ncbi:MAG: flagellar motor protein MotA [Bdellovibrionales bacterium CG12_big_fil_rev_8_21_14_0_65_38_15]|nr:MAG: flagellar motor protein MotA [Bdellovibrionales bacterium CG22_combo_CG10-13_8_21_14_all_38_13]PIQ56159.1 MAG: flagellar motor protein MotA [Bdellovibrionales bacterium CG12_big_fil_rev_8_21_14_0_65_38_15]PIR28825.1 MAG: flagellar motor protein MotA [Bdellovibrionales bacterium CG11_big_fil_rev_8_21_14_0_20_38_13]